MKKLFSLVFLVAILFGACEKDESIGPPALLYQRWHLHQARHIGDEAWISYDTDAYYDTEYQPDGSLVYRRNGVVTQAGCCAPTQFERTRVGIVYAQQRTCPNVRCGPLSNATITRLNTDLLELNDGIYVTQYRSVR